MSAVAKAIPTLKPENLHKGSVDGPNGTHCLLGHCNHLQAPYEVRRKLEKTMRRMAKRRGYDNNIPGLNDDPKNSKEYLADFWNRARRRVIQDEWRANRKAQAAAAAAGAKNNPIVVKTRCW